MSQPEGRGRGADLHVGATSGVGAWAVLACGDTQVRQREQRRRIQHGTRESRLSPGCFSVELEATV